jgi:7-cyano-7-deazaguanine synthase
MNNQKVKVVSLISGGQDSLAVTLDMIKTYGKENVIGLGINYGQRHFIKENEAAISFCKQLNIPREIINIPIYQINKGRCLTDKNIDIPQEMDKQIDTVVNFRNTIFTTFAAGYALQNGCNAVALGVNFADFQSYRDCRPIFYKLLNLALQAGITAPINGNNFTEQDIVIENNNFYIPDEKLDIHFLTPIINETKIQTVKRIVNEYGIEIYKNSWSCYNGGVGKYKGLHCSACSACIERKESFDVNGFTDPVQYIEIVQ